MPVTIRDVLEDEMFARAEPYVQTGQDSLDGMVRWVFANERADVAEFLSGGELLLIEGNTLEHGLGDMGLREYVHSLVDAKISGLAVELVEGVTQLPVQLTEEARVCGLPVIGLRARVPFVDISQEINTRIVREQMLFQIEVDTMSTSLRSQLARAESIEEVADVLSQMFSESVAIFDSEGVLAARSGQPFHVGDARYPAEKTVIVPVSNNGRPLVSVEISQRMKLLDEQTRAQLARITAPVIALFVQSDTRMGMISHIVKGPENGIHAGPLEAKDSGALLEALGYGGASIYFPFAIVMQSVVASIDTISDLIVEVESQRNTAVLCTCEGGAMFGCLVASDAGEGAGNFAARCEVSLRAIAVNPNLWVVLGKAALNTASVVDGFGALRATIAAEEPAYGSSLSVVDTIFDRFLAIDDTKQAAHMLVTHMLGVELLDNPVLLATLCACCDNADNKTGACEQLGIQRQTLYNRLDKVTEMTGVSQTNRKAWSALLFCAKIGGAWLKALP